MSSPYNSIVYCFHVFRKRSRELTNAQLRVKELERQNEHLQAEVYRKVRIRARIGIISPCFISSKMIYVII